MKPTAMILSCPSDDEFPDVTDPREPDLPDPTYPFDPTPLEF